MSRSPATQPVQRIAEFDAAVVAPLHIVLVEPCIPPNTGNIARLCAATGATLHLVEPLGFSIDDRALKRAGLDYWDALSVVVYPSLAAFLETPLAARAWFFSTRAVNSYAQANFAYGDVLVFGSETKGLPGWLLAENEQRLLRIPMRPGAVRSLNLATAAGIVTYAAMMSIGESGLI